MNRKTLKTLWQDHEPGLLGRKYDYAVLCPFVEKGDGLHLLFEVRSASLRRQGGQVCFPGGRMEPGETAEQCALRETEEELQIPAAHIQLLGRTDYLCQPGKFSLQPVPGLVDGAGLRAMRPSPAEVEEVFTVPLEFFQSHPPKIYVYTLEPDVPPDFPYDAVGVPPTYPWEGGEAEVPIWRWEGRAVWGLTGRIVKNLLETMGEALPDKNS
ncbi:putative hydrolase [Oscillibacter valericigenes Sjm18-20]|nr:putative hydrolase [Oscillibacter valericigenes Sjm18-20]